MASNINPNAVDATYPVAGVDNDTQGFRTNFANIKSNFQAAAAEITALQQGSVLKSQSNNLSGTVLTSAEVRDFRETHYDLGVVSGALTINYSNGSSQSLTTSDTVSLAFSAWPTEGTRGKIAMRFVIANVAHTVTLPTSVKIGANAIAGYDAVSGTLTFAEAGTYILEFSTDDAGQNIAITEFSRPLVRVPNKLDLIPAPGVPFTLGSATPLGNVNIVANVGNTSVTALSVSGTNGSVGVTFFRTPTGGNLVIAAGVVTVTNSYHTVGTEASNVTDDLDTINGGVDGAHVYLRAIDTNQTVVVKNGTGNIVLAGSDFTLDNSTDILHLMYDAALGKWLEVSRSNNGA